MNILLITQARVSSSRLPGKVLLPLGDTTVLDLHLSRIKKSKRVTSFCVATTQESGVEQILEIAKNNKFSYFIGDRDDVLDRFYQAALVIKPEVVVRVTSDCPLLDAVLIDDLIEKFLSAKVDYASNVLVPTLPDGMSVEVFKFSALEKTWNEAKLKSEREHVTPYIWKNAENSISENTTSSALPGEAVKSLKLFSVLSVLYKPNLSHVRLTIDHPEDLFVLNALVKQVGKIAPYGEYIKALNKNPELAQQNEKYKRLEGYKKSVQDEKL